MSTIDSNESPAESHFDEQTFLGTRLTSLLGVLLPFVGFAAGVVLLWDRGFGWVYAAVLVGMYLITGFGITVGYHRYFTHRSFQTSRVMQCLLGVSGSMAAQGPLLKWVATHRRHHHCSDQAGDPHSPHEYGQGAAGVLRGMCHAHVGWIFQPSAPDLHRYIPDLANDPMLRMISRYWVLWGVLGLLIPALLAGLLTWSWTGALLGFLWGGLARIFLIHHVTWSINSVCHLWGTRPFRSHDHSRNNFIFGWLGLGEGWHNNHHAFPRSARHGLRWWEFDAGYIFIRGLAMIGLVWDVTVPGEARQAAKAAS